MSGRFANAHVLLCVTGGIAAYKAAALTSSLVQNGATVDVMMTAEAEKFIGALTFSALTSRAVYTSLWDAPERIPHIRLVREAAVALVVPATANVIAKLANGICDDLVTTALAAARIPVILAPAMNDAMYRNEATQKNLRALHARGYAIVEPATGFLAERENGMGRLAQEADILAALETALARSRSMANLRVLVTAGPTREHFDPVRFLSNPSTGATGIALAREAHARGARVTLVLGPTHLAPPPDVETITVTTAQEMHAATMAHADDADLIIASAAVSDWRPAERSERKEKKRGKRADVRLVANPDIAADLGARKGKAFFLGFAAETHDHEAHGREKLARKRLDAIAVNDVSGRRGFGEGTNAVTLLWGKNGHKAIPNASKDVLAALILDEVEALRATRH